MEALPSTMTNEPRGMSGSGGKGSEGVMGEEGVMEWTVGAFIFSGLIQREFDLSVQAAFFGRRAR